MNVRPALLLAGCLTACDRDVGAPEAALSGTGTEADITSSPRQAGDGGEQASGSAERIVFSSLRPSNWDIYLFERPGSVPERLTSHSGLDYDAAFSPDGTLARVHVRAWEEGNPFWLPPARAVD